MTDTEKGCREWLMRRMLAAVVSGVALQFSILCCVLVFANLSTDYARWLGATWTSVASLRMLAYLVVLGAACTLQCLVLSKSYLRVPSYYKSRFVKLCATVTTAQTLLVGASYVAVGVVSVWLHLLLLGGRYGSLTADCDRAFGQCLVEEHYFLLLGGAWGGLYSLVRTSGDRYIPFPVVARSKLSRSRRTICAELPNLVVSSVWSTLYYAIAYYLLGSYCRTALLSLLSLQTEARPLGLSSLNLLSRLSLHQFLLVSTINGACLFFEIHSTEWIRFELDSNHGSQGELSLIDALSMRKIPIIQHLAYLDLVTLAQKQRDRRRILFTLSQPGGHPYSWNCVVQRCTHLLEKFSSDLNDILARPQHEPLRSHGAKIFTAAPPSLRKSYAHHMRKLAADAAAPTSFETDDARQAAATDCGSWSIQKFVKLKRDALVTHLLSKPLVNYIFAEQDENRVRYVLLGSQRVIWAAEAISSLSVFSLTEDSYGIVHKDVPNVIGVLLSVKQALDKLQKSTALSRKMQTDDKLAKEILTSLRSAIKRSLYRIIINFRPYMDDLILEPIKVEQLQGFLNYKE